MSLVGELIIGFQVEKIKDDIFISQRKYTRNIVNKFG